MRQSCFFVDMPRLSVEIQHDGLAVVNCVPVSRFENMKRELDRFKVFNVVFIKFGRTENYAVNGTFPRTNFAGKISADHKSVYRFVPCLNGHVFYAQLWWNNQKTRTNEMLQMHFGARSEHAYPNLIYSPLTLDYFRLQLYNYCWVGMRVRKRELLNDFLPPAKCFAIIYRAAASKRRFIK